MPTLVRKFHDLSGVTRESGFGGYMASTRGATDKDPAGRDYIRNPCTDASTGGAGSGIPNERSDGQIGGVPLMGIRWMRWYERPTAIPATVLDRWLMLGCNEIHGITLPQATVQPEIAADKKRRLNANAGRSSARYFPFGSPLDYLNKWSANLMGVFYSNANNGWLVWYRDSGAGPKLVVEIRNQPITTEARNGYWKFVNYRNAQIQGLSSIDIGSGEIYDGEVPIYPLTGAPPPGDTTKPVIEVITPRSDAVITPGVGLPFEVKVSDDSGKLAKVWIGRVAKDGNKLANNNLPYENVPSGTVLTGAFPPVSESDSVAHLYVGVRDEAGNEASPWTDDAAVVMTAPPPPVSDEAKLRTLVTDIRGDLTMIRGRLLGVEEWTSLTAAQRASIIEARGAAERGLARPVPPDED